MTPLWRALVVAGSAAAVAAAAPPGPSRPVLTAAGAALAAALVAAATGWRFAGTLTVVLTTGAVLLAGVLDPSPLGPARLVAAGLLLVALLDVLEVAEDDRAGVVTVLAGPRRRRLGRPALAVGAAVLVAATAGQEVVPSVATAIAGLFAAAAALVIATRAHRN